MTRSSVARILFALLGAATLTGTGNVARGGAIGPDVIIGDLYEVMRFGRVGNVTAYAVGTDPCNVGDERVSWISYNNQHPVWVQNMYKLKDGRFQQIGMSRVRHGFYALSQSRCTPCLDPTNGNELGVGCSGCCCSAYSNGVQANMSLRSDVDAYTGCFPYPWSAPQAEEIIDKRIQVHGADLDPDLNEGALYFTEAQYIAPDDAAAGNGENNLSHRRAVVTADSEVPGDFFIDLADETMREQPAIRAWKGNDSSVVETDVRVPGEGLFIVSAKASEIGDGYWHYEYAVFNLNSDRSAGSFAVPVPIGMPVENIGFHDVDYHSGEVYDGTDWEIARDDQSITWATETYAENPNANALRFSTLYNFWFDAMGMPSPVQATIGLFKPGTPQQIQAATIGPLPPAIDCNENGIEDICDVVCTPACPGACGESADCDGNLIPDECELDCNDNGVVDACDIANCLPHELWCKDCNGNLMPDGCDPDENWNGIPDDCETFGPDLIIADLYEIMRFGRVADISAFAVGTNACNVGDERVSWISYTNEHPVWVQNMYKLKDGEFQQIGMSWATHGFYAVSQSFCGPCLDSTDGSELGVGCSDPLSAYLNGVQGNMSLRSDVDAYTVYFPYPWEAPDPEEIIGKRIQIHDADLDPDLNEDALYFVEAHYLAADDATAGNARNNASHRRVTVTEGDPDFFGIYPTDQTERERPAIRAWKDNDPTVVETDVQVPGEGLFIVAAKASVGGGGFWHYEYAVYNLNSDRSAGSFAVPLPPDTAIQNIGFHDIHYHSGEIYDSTDWQPTRSDNAIVWTTQTYQSNPNANALRFGTLYNFRFDAYAPPSFTTASIGLFKPGSPSAVGFETVGPSSELIDCNDNGISDYCDTTCEGGCQPPCGQSDDCNNNAVPDECEPDCNENAIADECDIRDCPPEELWCADCNDNGKPDECDPDCDGDGIPDDCDDLDDTDADGVPDCFDLCPGTPPGACTCPLLGWCCWDFTCIPDYPRGVCIDQGGTPDCIETPCRDGCLIGDYDLDGDRDLFDCGAFQRCFSGSSDDVGFVPASEECLQRVGFDDDQDIDLDDYFGFYDSFEQLPISWPRP